MLNVSAANIDLFYYYNYCFLFFFPFQWMGQDCPVLSIMHQNFHCLHWCSPKTHRWKLKSSIRLFCSTLEMSYEWMSFSLLIFLMALTKSSTVPFSNTVLISIIFNAISGLGHCTALLTYYLPVCILFFRSWWLFIFRSFIWVHSYILHFFWVFWMAKNDLIFILLYFESYISKFYLFLSLLPFHQKIFHAIFSSNFQNARLYMIAYDSPEPIVFL